MQWLNFPALAEYEDRFGVVRQLYGCTILGRFEFAERLQQISDRMATLPADQPWTEAYRKDAQLRHAIDSALACWGIEPNNLTPAHIEAFLLYREQDGQYVPGYLSELLADPTAEPATGDPPSMADMVASIATHCQTLTEAIELASTVPSSALTDILAAKNELAEAAADPAKKPRNKKKANYIKDNFDELMRSAG
jgi:hypothetical protein